MGNDLVIHVTDYGDPLQIFMDSTLVHELAGHALNNGISMNELLTDLIVTAFRTNAERNYPSFEVPSKVEPAFTDDGYRVVYRAQDYSTLCPRNGISFEIACSELQAGLACISEAEILQVT